MKTVLFAVLLLAPATPFSQEQAQASVGDLNFFLGKWSCDGKFVKSGKEISADVSFESTLGGK
jgi:hypothetical protein